MAFQFNPRSDTGNPIGRFEFRVVYEVLPSRSSAAAAAVERGWDEAYSRCLMHLSSTRVEDLRSPEGRERVTGYLREELTATLFPGLPEDRLATVVDIWWKDYVIAR